MNIDHIETVLYREKYPFNDEVVLVKHHSGWWDRVIRKKAVSYRRGYIKLYPPRGFDHWKPWYYAKSTGDLFISADTTPDEAVPPRLARHLDKMMLEYLAAHPH